MKKTATLLIAALCAAATVQAKTATATSPDGQIRVTLDDEGGKLTLAAQRGATTLLEPSEIALDVADAAKSPKIKGMKLHMTSEEIDAPFYRQKNYGVDYNILTVKLSNGQTVEVRLFDDGFAYRFATDYKAPQVTVEGETADYRFPADITAYLPYSTNDEKPLAMAFQNYYHATPLSHAKDKPAFLPVTADYGDGLKMTITESDLRSYPGMFVKADTTGLALKGMFAPYPAEFDHYPWRKQRYVTKAEPYIARTEGRRTYPWRVFAVTTDDTQMPVNNLVYTLAEPSRIADTSWIRPGKVAWDWWNDWGLTGVDFKAGINTETYKHYIDFAAANGIEYVVLDEGWYDPRSGDMLTVVPDIDLAGLVEYGRERGVGLVLWTVFNVLDDQLQAACDKYSKMGIKGFKVDFLDRDDQEAVDMAYRVADECARHKLFLDYHGYFKPTGLNRTYPNVLNFEGVFGMEEVKWADKKTTDMPLYDVTFPYIRMLAGPVDYTPGATRNASKADWQPVYYNPMSMGTRAHQLAAYIVHDSPFTMLCDAPTNYRGEDEMVDFIAGLPVVFDETRVLQGRMGEYIVTARRDDGSWYLAGMTNWDPREVTIDFGFLPAGTRYKATIMADGINADKNATDYKRTEAEVDASTRMPLRMASGGGFAMRLDPVPAGHSQAGPVPANRRGEIPGFYNKYIETDGFYVVSSENVSDEALERACDIIGYMLLKRPDVKKHMVDRGAHVLIIGKDEATCDIPEYKHVCTDDPDSIAYINWRARGFGGEPEDPLSSGCGEENLLALPTDKYVGENILVHEFAHLIHTIGIAGVEPDFNDRLQALFESAKAKNLWEGTYALSNKEEYFAEAVQSFFNCNRYAHPANGIHNWVNRRAKLKAYDPEMYNLLREYFYEVEIPLANEIHK